MYRLNRFLFASLILLMTILYISSPIGEKVVFAQNDNPYGIEMDVSYGYQNTARGGRYLPIHISFRNGGDNFRGEIYIKTRESDLEIYEYVYPVQIGGNFEDTYYIPLGTGSRYMYIYLSDEKGNKILTEKLELNTMQDNAGLLIGILSDTPEKMQYLDNASINYGVVFSELVTLDTEHFPRDAIGLSQLDMIFISNYRIRDLDEAQSRALMEWVKNGGVMVLGTGERVNDTLGRYAPELLDDMYEDPLELEINLSEDLEIDNPGNSSIFLSCVDISLHGGNILMRTDGIALLSVVHKEKGLIAVAAYDFKDLDEYVFRYDSYASILISKILGNDRIENLTSSGNGRNSDIYWEMQPFINSGPVDKEVNLSLYMLMILLYIIIAGPGVFLFLKQRGKTRFYRKSIIVSAIIFGGLIYLYGEGTRYKSSFFHYLTIKDADENNILEKTYVNIRNPYSSTYEVNISPEYSVYPIAQYFQGGNVSDFKEEDGANIQFRYSSDITKVTIADFGAFEPGLLSLESSYENKDHKGFFGEISLFADELGGYIRNDFDCKVENVIILLYGKIVLLGDFEEGETKDLSSLETYSIPLSPYYMVAGFINGNGFKDKSELPGSIIKKITDRTNILSFYMHMTSSGYTSAARVVGFSGEKEAKTIFIGDEMETSGVSLLSSSIPVNSRREDRIYRSALSIEPDILNGFFIPDSNSMYSVEPLVAEYQLGDDIDIEEMNFEFVSENLTLEPAFENLYEFEGTLSFYNYSTGQYDEKEFKKYTKEELKNYLTPPNSIRIKYIYKGEDDVYTEALLPMIWVIGRER